MKAAVEKDTTSREITVRVVDGPIVDVSESWHRRPRRIQVDKVVIQVLDGETRSLRVSGGVVLRTGKPSEGQYGKKEWSQNGQVHELLSKAPEWVQQLWREAPAGVIDWKLEAS